MAEERAADAEVARTLGAAGPSEGGRRSRPSSAPRRSDRPLSAQLNRLVNMAHAAADMQLKSALPGTSLYDEFEKRVGLATRRSWSSLDHRGGHPETSRWQAGRPLSAVSSREENRWPPAPSSGRGPPPAPASRSPKRRALEVTCQFDANVQEGDQRGLQGKCVYPNNMREMGPVAMLFKWYARRAERCPQYTREALVSFFTEDPEGAAAAAGSAAGLGAAAPPHPAWLQDHSGYVLGIPGVMNYNELMAFLQDFDVVPRLVSRTRAAAAFKASSEKIRKKPSGNNHPSEICFMEYIDCMVRLAVLAFSGDAAQEGKHPTLRTKVEAFMEHLDILGKNTNKLKNRLDALARLARDRAQNCAARKWDHITLGSSPGGGGGAGGPGLGAGAPPLDLLSVLMRHDVRTLESDQPRWVEFASPAIDMGVVPLGKTRKYRIVIRNRSRNKRAVSIQSANLPFATLSYSEHPLAPGLPRVVDIVATFNQPGEWLGTVSIAGSDHVAHGRKLAYARSVTATGAAARVVHDLGLRSEGGAFEEHCPIPVYARAAPLDG